MVPLEYSFIVSVSYATIYIIAFFITSIICARTVIKSRRQQKNKISTTKFNTSSNKSALSIEQKPTISIHQIDEKQEAAAFVNETKGKVDDIQLAEATQHDADAESDLEQKAAANDVDIDIGVDQINQLVSSNKSKWYEPVKEWFVLIKQKRKVYISLIPHIADQATDYGVIYEYYLLWQQSKQCGIDEVGDADPQTFFYASLFVVIFHRFLTMIAIFLLTKNWLDVLLQLFDILIAKTIFLCYKLKKNEPTNAQRYLQILEASFESAPQILVSLCFILKKSTLTENICGAAAEPISPIIYISTIFSLWSLVARVSADDKTMYLNQRYNSSGDGDREPSLWRDINFKYNQCPCVNWRWCCRVFLWRFMEITHRVFLCVLLWVNLGGLALSIILGIETIYCGLLCICTKSINPLMLLMYLTINSGLDGEGGGNAICFYCRGMSNFIYQILITVFAKVDFEAAEVEEADTRHRITIGSDIGLFMLVYVWITSCVYPLAGACAGYYSNAGNNERDLYILVKEGYYDEAFELIQFGMRFNAKSEKGTLLSKMGSAWPRIELNINALRLIAIIVVVEPSLISKDDECYYIELAAANGGSLLHLASMTIDLQWMRDSDIIKTIIDEGHADINSVDNAGNTAMHLYAMYGRYYTYEKLIDYGIDLNIKNKAHKTAYDIISARDVEAEPKISKYALDKFKQILSGTKDGDDDDHHSRLVDT